MNKHLLNLPRDILESFCRQHHIKKMAVFGSAIRDDFSDQSDIDILIEFKPGHVPGLKFFEIEAELSQLLGRKVDLQTTKFISQEFRQQILEEALTAYEQA